MEAFQLFHAKRKLRDPQLQIAFICYVLKLDYNTLMEQPDWWVDAMQALLAGKGQAEELANKPSGKSI